MPGVFAWRLRWRYVDSSGKLLQQFVEMQADFVVTPITGSDGALRPDPTDAMNRIAGNFPTPPGTNIVLLGVSSSQDALIYL